MGTAAGVNKADPKQTRPLPVEPISPAHLPIHSWCTFTPGLRWSKPTFSSEEVEQSPATCSCRVPEAGLTQTSGWADSQAENWKLTLKSCWLKTDSGHCTAACKSVLVEGEEHTEQGQQWLFRRWHRLKWTWPVSKLHPEINPYIAHEAPSPRNISLLHLVLHNVCFWSSQEPLPRDRAPSSICLSPQEFLFKLCCSMPHPWWW